MLSLDLLSPFNYLNKITAPMIEIFFLGQVLVNKIYFVKKKNNLFLRIVKYPTVFFISGQSPFLVYTLDSLYIFPFFSIFFNFFPFFSIFFFILVLQVLLKIIINVSLKNITCIFIKIPAITIHTLPPKLNHTISMYHLHCGNVSSVPSCNFTSNKFFIDLCHSYAAIEQYFFNI
jgi:hypothetical protein